VRGFARGAIIVALALAACGESHPPMEGADAGPPAPCESPSIAVLVRSDYLPGVEVVSVLLELNDRLIHGTGVTEADNFETGINLGPLCAVRPNSRATVRFLDARGGDVAARQALFEEPVDGDSITFVITRD